MHGILLATVNLYLFQNQLKNKKILLQKQHLHSTAKEGDSSVRKPLAPVFIMEEDVRPLDLTSSVECLIIRDISNLTEMNFQHPELVPLLLSFEPVLKENEWIQVSTIFFRGFFLSLQFPFLFRCFHSIYTLQH